MAVWLVAVVLPPTFADTIQNYANNSRQLFNDVSERVDHLFDLDEADFMVDSWIVAEDAATVGDATLRDVEIWLRELDIIRVRTNEIRDLDLEIYEINEALVAEIYESEILDELLVVDFEFPDEFDAELEVLSDEQLGFTLFYQEIVQILRVSRDELEEAYSQLMLIPEETEPVDDDYSDSDEDDFPEDEDQPDEDEEDLMTLEDARTALREFLVYLSSALDEDDFTEVQWSEWQILIEQAHRILGESDDASLIQGMLELLMDRYGISSDDQGDEDIPVIELLSLTRPEFNSMSLEEIAEMAYEGGYVPIGAMPNIAPHGARNVVNACPNVDGAAFVTNVIVDGVVCVGTLEDSNPLLRNSVDVTDAAGFIAAWNDNANTTQIVLMNNITIPSGTTFGGRTASVGIESNLDSNSLTLHSTGATGTNPILTLNAAPASGSTLYLNNVNFNRTHSNASTNAADPNAASTHNIFNATAVNSENWHIYIQGDVTTGVSYTDAGAPTTTRPQIINISGLLQAPRASLTVEGTGNQLNMFGNGVAGDTTETHQIFVQNFEMLENAELTIRSHGSSATSLRIDNVQTLGGSRLNSTLTVSRPGSVILRPNADLTILNAGIRDGHDGATGASWTTAANGLPFSYRSHGIHGFISTFTMESGSTLDIDVTGVGFRSRTRTEYTMTGGAVKNILARPAGSSGNAAFVLAHRNNTGTALSGTQGDSNMVNRAPIHNHSVVIDGEGTQLNLIGSPTATAHSEPRRANLFVAGDNTIFTVSNGAELNNTSHRTTAMMFFGQGTRFYINNDGIMNVTVNGSANADSGAFRFLQTGGQTFTIDDGIVSITANNSSAGLLRAFGGNNAFYVRGGGLLEMVHNPGSAGTGVDFDEGNTTMGTADRFILHDHRSEVYIRTNSTVIDGDGGTSITRVEAHPGTVFQLSGNTAGLGGIFNAGRLHLLLDAPLFFDFTQRHTGNGLLFNTTASAANPSTMIGLNTDLALWRNNRPGNAAGLATADPITGAPGGSWSNMNFNLRPSNQDFMHATLLNNGGTTNEPRFSTWFNSSVNMPGTGTGATSGNAGWRQIRRMSANNATPVVDVLRIPTDADQRIFGHVTIPEGNRSARSAFDNEVFVDLAIRNPQGDVVQQILHAPTGTRAIFDGPEHEGVFEAVVDFGPNSGFEPGTTYLPAGYTVEVITARRSASGVSGITNPPRVPYYHESCSADDIDDPNRPRCVWEDVLTDVETVRDVTPPPQVEDVVGLVLGNELFGGQVSTASTSITGTNEEPGSIIRIGRVSATNPINAVEWLRDEYNNILTTTVQNDGTWAMDISDVTLVGGERLSIYASDNELLDGEFELAELIPIPEIPVGPEIIFRPELANPQGLANMANRYRVANINLPRTTITNNEDAATNNTPAWAGETMGNINFHHGQRTAFHDATGEDAFDYAYILTVIQVIEVDFMWNYPDAPDGGYFHRDAVLEGETVDRPIPDPSRDLYHFLCWAIAPNVGCGSDGNGFDFDTELDENLRLYAQWLGQQGFDFIKTDEMLYEDFDEKERLADAVFVLERERYIPGPCMIYDEDDVCTGGYEDGEYIWEPVAGPDEIDIDGNLIEDVFISQASGLVELNLFPGFRYRLTEIVAPDGFIVPAGHWYIELGMDFRTGSTNVAHVTITRSLYESCDVEDEDSYGNCPIREDVPFVFRDGAWFVGNMPLGNPFSFFKTNDYLYMDMGAIRPEHPYLEYLSRAVFELRRRGDNGEWPEEPLETVTSDSNGFVEFEELLTLDGEYKLTEIRAPRGFRVPHGYWIITWNNETDRFEIVAGGTVALVPAFRETCSADVATIADCDSEDIVLYLGNFPETVLPGTGGLGAMTLTLIGGLGLAFVVLLYLRGKTSDELEKLEEIN